VSAESQGQQHNIGPSVGKKMDKEQGHQPQQTRIKRSNFDSWPMGTAYPVAQFRLLREDYAFEASTGGKSDPASLYTPRTWNTEIPRGPYTTDASGSRGRGRGHEPPGGSDKKQGGGLMTEFRMGPTSLRGRGGRGQDNRSPTKRDLTFHAGPYSRPGTLRRK